MKILSIDSGVEKTGFALFENKKYLISGLIKTSSKKTLEKRLEEIYSQIEKIIDIYHPNLIILEKLFFLKNQKTAITVSQAQGVILLLAAQKNIKVVFLTPLEIKQAITGYGLADKKSIKKMLTLTINDINVKNKNDDEIDAIACGIAYLNLKFKSIS
ncbi:MAG: crossover junction endodeoxyribonuclease RuvC [Patescibacteria group bacterium]|nr:crossover junction endodeoxyribonuclease RuvC [Patescibacteria group bacterium]